jgi:hypothetical protein
MRNLLILLLWCVLVSCEMQVEVEVPGEPSKIVVNSVFSPDSTWLITIHSSSHILSSIRPPLNNLTVFLRDEHGEEIVLTEGPLDTQSNMPGRNFVAAARPEAGISYEISASSDGFTPVNAIAKAPIVVGIESAVLDSAGMIVDEYSQGSLPIEFTFRDPDGLGDYYYPQLVATYEITRTNPETGEDESFTYNQPLYLQRERSNADIIDFNGEFNIALSDNSFDGKLYTARLYATVTVFPGTEPPKRLRFSLYHAGEEYVRYFKSVRLQENTSGNPFAQPVQVYTNVEGGLGIFAGYTRSSWEFIE